MTRPIAPTTRFQKRRYTQRTCPVAATRHAPANLYASSLPTQMAKGRHLRVRTNHCRNAGYLSNSFAAGLKPSWRFVPIQCTHPKVPPHAACSGSRNFARGTRRRRAASTVLVPVLLLCQDTGLFCTKIENRLRLQIRETPPNFRKSAKSHRGSFVDLGHKVSESRYYDQSITKGFFSVPS